MPLLAPHVVAQILDDCTFLRQLRLDGTQAPSEACFGGAEGAEVALAQAKEGLKAAAFRPSGGVGAPVSLLGGKGSGKRRRPPEGVAYRRLKLADHPTEKLFGEMPRGTWLRGIAERGGVVVIKREKGEGGGHGRDMRDETRCGGAVRRRAASRFAITDTSRDARPPSTPLHNAPPRRPPRPSPPRPSTALHRPRVC